MSSPKTLAAEPLFIDASTPPPALEPATFNMGTSRNPDGHTLTLDHTTLLRDGKPWLPVMGEFHYARYPQSEWRDELLKMKAGGITIVSTYVFWIHHEEIENQWNWTGQRNLHAFAQTCKDVGLPLIVRIGPWDHGEVRNGGFPDWLVASGPKQLRTEDPAFLAKVQILYQQIAEQLKGLLWKDNGPVIGVQLDNEFGGPAEYLLHLKKLAQDAGLDVPLYTRTGWPNLKSPMPFGEIAPLFGAYAEGFWDRSLDSMPGRYWQAFIFRPQRTDNAVATDQLGQRESRDEADARQYPYLTCELGGGMMSSYHRRIVIDPIDVLSVALCKVGSGSNLPGYYMYHGGTNPDSQTGISLQESQSTTYTNYNDMPEKNYDFQSPLGANGEVRDSYHVLRRLHLFLQDWGPQLTMMHPVFPSTRPASKNDDQTVRWAVRTDGNSGFLFISQYQRGLLMKSPRNTQFEIKLKNENLKIPAEPLVFPEYSGEACILPFNMDLNGAKLIYSTAQPICQVTDNGIFYYIFGKTNFSNTEFVFDKSTAQIAPTSAGEVSEKNGRIYVSRVTNGTSPAIEVTTSSGQTVRIILLSSLQSSHCWKGQLAGKDRVVLSDDNIVFDGQKIRLYKFEYINLSSPKTPTKREGSFDILPAPSQMRVNNQTILGEPDGAFKSFSASVTAPTNVNFTCKQISKPGPSREIPIGARNVAQAPLDKDFKQAAVWRFQFSGDVNPTRDLLLRIDYTGDVARFYLDGKLLIDDFFNGQSMDLGLKRFAPDIYHKELLLKILPEPKDAPINLWQAKKTHPTTNSDSTLSIMNSGHVPSSKPTTASAEPAAYLKNIWLLENTPLEFESR